MLILNDKEVKESLKKNEEKLTLRFNTCLILMKDIKHVVRSEKIHGRTYIFFTNRVTSLFMLMSRMKRMKVKKRKRKKLKK